MKYNKIFFLIAISIILFSFVSAEESGGILTGKKNQCIQLVQTVANATFMNLTRIVYPNLTIQKFGVLMEKDGTSYNYTFCSTQSSGLYVYETCGNVDGILTCVQKDITINPQGIPSSESRTNAMTRTIYFVFGLAILLFMAFFFTKNPPVKWTYFIFAVIFAIISLNTIVISLKDEIVNPTLESFFDSFTAISFYFYWFAGGLLILLWLFAFINTWIYKKNLENARRFGIA